MAENRVQEALKVDLKIEYPQTFYGYKYYIAFAPLHEILTNSKSFFDALEEGKVYEISYVKTNRVVAPNTASVVVSMKRPKILGEVLN